MTGRGVRLGLVGLVSVLAMCAAAQAERARVPVAVLAAGSADADILVPIVWALRAAVDDHETLKTVSISERLAGEGAEDPIEAGRFALDEGRRAADELDLERAIRAFETAARHLSAVPEGRDDAADALRGLAEARGAMKDEAGATAAYRRLFALDPSLVLDDDGLSPTMKRALRRARGDGGARDRGSRGGRVRVDAIPGPAAVFVDGKFVGVTPKLLEDLDTPTVAVRLEVDGNAPWVRELTVRDGQGIAVEAALEPLPRATLYEDLVEKMSAQIERETVGPALKELKALLFADQVVLIRLQSPGLEAVLFDLKANRRVRAARASLGQGRTLSASAAADVVDALYRGVDARAPGQAELLPEEPETLDGAGGDGLFAGLTRNWWFWPAVGVVAATAVIVPVAVLASEPDPALKGKDGTGAVILRF